jgi:hypothetical protein
MWWTTCPQLYRRAQAAILRWEHSDGLSFGFKRTQQPQQVPQRIALEPGQTLADASLTTVPPASPSVAHVLTQGILSDNQRNALAGILSSTFTTILILPLNRITVLMYSSGGVSMRAAFGLCRRQGLLSFFRGWFPSFLRLVRWHPLWWLALNFLLPC